MNLYRPTSLAVKRPPSEVPEKSRVFLKGETHVRIVGRPPNKANRVAREREKKGQSYFAAYYSSKTGISLSRQKLYLIDTAEVYKAIYPALDL